MGRPSKLTEKQWLDIAERMASGEESVRALAREFKVSESTIRERLSAQTERVKAVANQILATERNLKALPISAQITAHNLADQLRAMTSHVAGAAAFGASTAHRLAGIANAQVAKIDDADPMESQEVMQAISALTKISNDAMVPALALIKANQSAVKDDEPARQQQDPPSPHEFEAIMRRMAGEV